MGIRTAVLPLVLAAAFASSGAYAQSGTVKVAWIDHFESYVMRGPALFEGFVQNRELDIRAELDGALRLHRQREPRIEDDVHNVRLAEISLHRDRMSRHCRVCQACLSEYGYR